jgi:serine/threonine-protein kinase RIO1
MQKTTQVDPRIMQHKRLVAKWTSSNNTNLVLSRQAPVHLPPPSVFKSFITLNDALGDRSCVIKQLMHFLS